MCNARASNYKRNSQMLNTKLAQLPVEAEQKTPNREGKPLRQTII